MIYQEDHSLYGYLFCRSNEELEKMLKMRELPGYKEKPTQEDFVFIEQILRMRKEAPDLREKYPMEVLQRMSNKELGKLLAYARDYESRVMCIPVLLDIVEIIHQREFGEQLD